MKQGLIVRLCFCIFVFSFFLYSYIEKQNRLTELRIQIPEVVKEIQVLNEEIERLNYEIDHFESPAHLMELARCAEFSHLKHPFVKDILSVTEGYAVHVKGAEEPDSCFHSPVSVAIGAKSLSTYP